VTMTSIKESASKCGSNAKGFDPPLEKNPVGTHVCVYTVCRVPYGVERESFCVKSTVIRLLEPSALRWTAYTLLI